MTGADSAPSAARAAKSFLSTLAVLAAASAPAHASEARAAELLQAAARAAAPLTACAASADDLVGEVALRIWSRHRHVLESGKLRPYVETSVRNCWRDRVRRRGRVTPFSDLREELQAAPEPVAPAPGDVEAAAVAGEFRAALSAADRDVLLHLEAGRSDREIARLTGRTRHWARAAVERIRDRARVHLLGEAPATAGRARRSGGC